MGFTVLRGGLLTTVQDAGRYGFQGQGFPVCGAMDLTAFRLANLLLGNPPDEAALEVTLLGPSLEFDAPTCVAITGGDFSPTLSGTPVPAYTALRVRPGDVLTLGGARTGTRGYIAFSGLLDVQPVLGSRSTCLACGVGGFHGRKLEAGDRLGERSVRLLSRLGARRLPPPDYDRDDGVLRVVPGPQDGLFTPRGLETFLTGEYTVTARSDRMGMRLEGPAIAAVSTSDILSDGIAPGAVQVASDGQPIVLLSDRQTTGGYAKIATLASVDIPRLVQTRPDRKVRFRAVSVDEARRLLLQEHRSLQRLRRRFAPGPAAALRRFFTAPVPWGGSNRTEGGKEPCKPST